MTLVTARWMRADLELRPQRFSLVRAGLRCHVPWMCPAPSFGYAPSLDKRLPTAVRCAGVSHLAYPISRSPVHKSLHAPAGVVRIAGLAGHGYESSSACSGVWARRAHRMTYGSFAMSITEQR